AAVAPDDVLAGVEALVVDLRPQRAQRRAPRRLAAADVEHAPDRPAEVVLGDGDGERDLALELLARSDLMTRVAIPLLEIGTIVDFLHDAATRPGVEDASVKKRRVRDERRHRRRDARSPCGRATGAGAGWIVVVRFAQFCRQDQLRR